MSNKVTRILSNEEIRLRRKLRLHLEELGFTKSENGELQVAGSEKDIVRSMHRAQRNERLRTNREFISANSKKLLCNFASGAEIEPARISPVLERVSAGTHQSDLFRFASLTWSVPVSNGFGRRLRYLVWDENNGKLIGLIAIGDPVFNLAVRDILIGWDSTDRSNRLVNLMDAYVLGSLPPYNALLAGKLVACLLRSQEIYDDFERTYGHTRGIISGKQKKAKLLAVTTTSSMGRSSVYNRLKLGNVQYLKSIGYTGGWGHFHISDQLFGELRDYLRDNNHSCADQHQFGQGPNWKLRTTRAALSALGFKTGMLRHGIQREVFICELATNATAILLKGKEQPDLKTLISVKEISALALERWILPRASRRLEYQDWKPDDLIGLIDNPAQKPPNQFKDVVAAA